MQTTPPPISPEFPIKRRPAAKPGSWRAQLKKLRQSAGQATVGHGQTPGLVVAATHHKSKFGAGPAPFCSFLRFVVLFLHGWRRCVCREAQVTLIEVNKGY